MVRLRNTRIHNIVGNPWFYKFPVWLFLTNFQVMKKSFISVCLLSFFLYSCYQPQRNCKDFKTGEFTFNYKVGDSLKTGRFVRDSKYSIDYFDNKIDSASIRWINECEFVLQDLDSKSGIHYKIISTTDSSYTFEYKSAVKDPNKKLIVKTGTAYRIR